ncbi:MAG: hypothetical protein AAB037_03790, partial [Chloroflexota bacterium]
MKEILKVVAVGILILFLVALSSLALSGRIKPDVKAALTTSKDKPAYCVPAQKGGLQEFLNTPASPYFIRHPSSDGPNVLTIIWLGGGSGTRNGVSRSWDRYLSPDSRVNSFRVVLPYASRSEDSFLDNAPRTYQILDEVLACYGGNPKKVHIAGNSNGGIAAFSLMVARPELFATLLGAPGSFWVSFAASTQYPLTAEQLKSFAGHAFFNGVGENDENWKDEAKEADKQLRAAGLDSVYV